MAEEEDIAEKSGRTLMRGVVVEFDFTVVDGSQLLFETARKVLEAKGIDLTLKLEAMHLAGGNYQGGLAELFGVLGKKCDPAATARDLSDAFAKALTASVAGAMTSGFKAFVNALTEKNIKVVIATRADIEAIKPAFAEFDPEKVVLYAEPSMTYGNCKWDAWARALNTNGLVNVLTVGVTGSGYGVKAALVAGMSAIAVVHEHVAYQDFGGSDVAVESFDASLADEVFRMLHM